MANYSLTHPKPFNPITKDMEARKIKFRALDEITMDWVYGTPVHDSDIKGRSYIAYGCTDGIDKIIVVKETIGQWTGLLDKNGVEIYEGDIINSGLGEILWSPLNAMFKVKWHDNIFKRVRGGNDAYSLDGEPLFMNAHIAWEVIGNVHENPELLT